MNTNTTLLLNSAELNFTSRKMRHNVPLSKPVENIQGGVENSITNIIDKIDEEKEKKSNKVAVAVGTSVAILSGLVILLNPKNSTKLIEKIKVLQQKSKQNIEKTKGNIVKNKFYKAGLKFANLCKNILEFSNNVNSIKDIGFKKLCTQEREYGKNGGIKKVLSKVGNFFVKILTKPYNWISRLFDSISKYTVKRKYKKSIKKMTSFDDMLNQYKSNIPVEKQADFEKILSNIKEQQKYFENDAIEGRLAKQESTMLNLQDDVLKKFKDYRALLKGNKGSRAKYIKENLTFWAQDIMKTSREEFEADGKKVVDNILGSEGNLQKDSYFDAMNILKSYLKPDENKFLEKEYKGLSKYLRKANRSETADYFDKKRDLVLGSAPTDVVSSLFLIGLGGLAIGTADTKEERLSKTITTGVPAVLGVGTSLALTAMLYSGVKGMLMGGLTGIVFSKVGSIIDKKVFGHDIDKEDKKTRNG